MNSLSRFDTSTLNPQPSTSNRHPAKLFPAGNGFVQVFGRAPGPFTIAWREPDGAQKRTRRTTWPKAKALAESNATRLANLQTGLQQLSPVDAASYLRCLELARPTGKPLELIVSEHAESLALLHSSYPSNESHPPSLVEAIRFFIENRPRDFKPLPIPALAAAFLAEKDGTISADYQSHLEDQLGKLAAAFTVPLHTVTAADLRAWLAGLKTKSGSALGPRARHNYRSAVDQLARWAQGENYLPRTWAEMDHVPDPGQKTGEIKILTPEEMTKLITARQHAEECGRARQTLIPFLALQGFAGIRHDEAVKLDWRDVHLEERHVYISKGIAKTGRDRIVPICDNLAAWLTPHCRRNGPITTLSPSQAINKAKKTAGLASGRNETRNTLRKSFISYRLAVTKSIAQVAEEAGNSPGVIRKHYGRPIPEAEGKRWFSIWPTAAEVLQLNFSGL